MLHASCSSPWKQQQPPLNGSNEYGMKFYSPAWQRMLAVVDQKMATRLPRVLQTVSALRQQPNISIQNLTNQIKAQYTWQPTLLRYCSSVKSCNKRDEGNHGLICN